MQITPLGDSALLIRVVKDFEAAPAEALDRVLAARRALQAAKIPGAMELAPAYTTVALFYDPAIAIDAGAPATDIVAWFEERIRTALSTVQQIKANRPERAVIEIPVCYNTEFGFD